MRGADLARSCEAKRVGAPGGRRGFGRRTRADLAARTYGVDRKRGMEIAVPSGHGGTNIVLRSRRLGQTPRKSRETRRGPCKAASGGRHQFRAEKKAALHGKVFFADVPGVL